MRLSFGRYVPLNSVIHKMDPRFKIAMIIVLIVAIFFPTGYTGYLVLSATILGMYALSRLSWRMLWRLFIPTTFIFAVILIINIFLMKVDANVWTQLLNGAGKFKDLSSDYGWAHHASSGAFAGNIQPSDLVNQVGLNPIGHYFRWKALWFSEKAVYSAFLMSWRIFLMITLTTIITGTTQPLEITIALEDLLSPLKFIGIPVHILSTIISIALRMIPDLIDEAGRIMKAQASRGIDMKNGNPKDKVRGLISLIIPLLVSSFQKAEDLAYAMDARDYDPHAKRTRFHQFSFSWMDIAIFITGAAIGIFCIVAFGYGPESWHIPYIDKLTLY